MDLRKPESLKLLNDPPLANETPLAKKEEVSFRVQVKFTREEVNKLQEMLNETGINRTGVLIRHLLKKSGHI